MKLCIIILIVALLATTTMASKKKTTKKTNFTLGKSGFVNKSNSLSVAAEKYVQKKAPVQGPLMKSGAFYSKQPVSSPANKAVTSQREKASKASKSKGSSKAKSLLSDLGSAYGKMSSGQASSNVNLSNAERTANQRAVVGGLTGAGTAKAGGRPAPTYLAARPQTKSMLERGFEIMTDPFGLAPRARAMYSNSSLGFGDKLYDKEGQNATGVIGNTDQLLSAGVPEEEVRRIIQDNPQQSVAPAPYLNMDTYNASRPKPTPVDDRNYEDDVDNENEMSGGDYNNKQLTDYLNAVGQDKYVLGGDDQIYTETEDNTPVQQNVGGTARKLMSSGAFGNGGGISTGGTLSGLDPETAAYIKKLKKSAGGDFGMSDAKKQIENLINSINAQYMEQERLGKSSLDEMLNQNLMGLRSRFIAGNTGDSEQRLQYEQLAQNESAKNLTELLAKLAASKTQDISGAKQKGFDMYQQIAAQKRAQQDKLAQLIQDLKDKEWERRYKMATLNKKYTQNDGGWDDIDPLG